MSLICISTQGQVGETRLSQNDILIGESVTLTYKISFPKKENFKFNPENNIIPSYRKLKNGVLSNSTSDDIEILSAFHDTVIIKGDIKEWIGNYELTVWDSGNFVLAKSSISIDDSTFYFPETEISCALVKGKEGQELYDIKESFAEIPNEPFSIRNFTQNNWWWLLPLILIIIGLFIYRRWKNMRENPEIIKVLSLKDRTLLAIDALEKERLWEKEKLKEHYTELSFILRSYLSSRYEINLLEKTTRETKLLLKQKGLHEETILVIISILGESDMVKFAKSQPEEIAVLKISQFARQVVAETSPIEFENAE